MQNVQPSLLTRSDTILGACEGIGEDFGFNPMYLRVALAVGVLANPPVAIGTYAVLAVAVLVSRRAFPNAVAAAPALTAIERPSLRGENDAQPAELAAAA